MVFRLMAVLIIFKVLLAESHEMQICVELCPPCLPQDKLECPPVSPGCPKKVKQTGCGCCWTCELPPGERCGIGHPPCGPGLECRGRNNESRLAALFSNNSICQRPALSDGSDQIHKESSKTPRYSRRIPSRRFPRHPHNNGPCTRHLETLMTSCETLPKRAWLPNCTRNGLYKPLQCMTSVMGEERRCWCVTRRGKIITNQKYINNTNACD